MSGYLQFKSLEKRYGTIIALDKINLSLDRGSILALLGPNGAGKSTLFGCLLGFTLPSAGEILCDEKPLRNSDRTRFGYVSERVALYPQRTVLENGVFLAQLKNCDAAELETQLKRVGLHAVRDRKVRQLSKGMLQRLGLALALCGQPELLVLDEPFNGLDPALLDSFQQMIREENERGATLLISTHTMSAIEPLASHIAILLDGKLAVAASLQKLRGEFSEKDSLESIYYRIARSTRTEAEEAFA